MWGWEFKKFPCLNLTVICFFHRNYAAAGVDPAVMVLSLMTLTSLKYAWCLESYYLQTQEVIISSSFSFPEKMSSFDKMETSFKNGSRIPIVLRGWALWVAVWLYTSAEASALLNLKWCSCTKFPRVGALYSRDHLDFLVSTSAGFDSITNFSCRKWSSAEAGTTATILAGNCGSKQIMEHTSNIKTRNRILMKLQINSILSTVIDFRSKCSQWFLYFSNLSCSQWHLNRSKVKDKKHRILEKSSH